MVMAQIPNISLEALGQYDERLMDPNAQKVGEKRRKDQFKKLIAGAVGVMPHGVTRGQCPATITLQKGSQKASRVEGSNSASHYSAL